MDKASFERYLEDKLEEELKEYQESKDPEELADLVEVVYALLSCKGVSREEFERIRIQKVEQRGAFMKRLLLKGVHEI